MKRAVKDARRKTGERSSGGDADISVDHRRSGVRNGRAGKNRETARRSKVDGRRRGCRPRSYARNSCRVGQIDRKRHIGAAAGATSEKNRGERGGDASHRCVPKTRTADTAEQITSLCVDIEAV